MLKAHRTPVDSFDMPNSESALPLRVMSLVALFVLAMVATPLCFAGKPGGVVASSKSQPKAARVNEHPRKNGTRVGAYNRKPTGPATRSAKCAACSRDSRGHIARSSKARGDFQKSHPCPSTGKITGACPGYVIDHVVPLKRGGADALSNMQWQTTAQAKAKDKIE
jgi:5-methylcytosine-specific restriction endonuclease McrA